MTIPQKGPTDEQRYRLGATHSIKVPVTQDQWDKLGRIAKSIGTTSRNSAARYLFETAADPARDETTHDGPF
jgi:hypothetical protein